MPANAKHRISATMTLSITLTSPAFRLFQAGCIRQDVSTLMRVGLLFVLFVGLFWFAPTADDNLLAVLLVFNYQAQCNDLLLGLGEAFVREVEDIVLAEGVRVATVHARRGFGGSQL